MNMISAKTARAAALVAGLALMAAPLWAETGAGTPQDTPRPVVSLIAALIGSQTVSYVGTVSAKIEVDLGFPMTGTIAERPVDQGDLVAKGDVMARLDPEDLDASLRAAQASVVVAEAQAKTARDSRDRTSALTERGVGAQTQLDDAERALVAAEARVEQARAAQARAEDMLALATLKAPRDGIVTRIDAEPGATVSAGQAVLQLSGTDARELTIDLSEAEAAALEPGTVFAARLVANPDVTAEARLDRIDPVAERSTRTRRAHLLLSDPPAAFRLGALAYAEPEVSAERGIVLPDAALLDASDGPAVWVVTRDSAEASSGKVHLTPVTPGIHIADYVVIKSGIAPGDEVVIRGIHSLEDSQIVGPRLSR